MKTTDAAFPAALRAAAEAWTGTPFRRLTATRGVGVDCANLTYSVLSDAGVSIPEMGAPTFGKTADTNFSEAVKAFLQDFVTRGNLEAVDDVAEPEIKPGDVLIFAVNQRMQHAVVAISPVEFCHVTPSSKAAIGCLDQRWKDKIIAHYRINEK